MLWPRQREIKTMAALGGGTWLLVFLYMTPRGDRILGRVGRTLFPDWLTK